MAQKCDDDRLLAEIPWIERPIGDKRLEDTNYFYKQIGEKCPLEEKIRRLQLFWMLNETFPFYLPQRYHAMDCLALHKNSKDGNYWANASVFLFNVSAYGHRFLADVQGYLKNGDPDLKTMKQLLSLYKDIKKKYLKHNLEESQSAGEFLLDPWVLLQLPLEPMILYQWTVAVLAEAYKFEKDINEIKNLSCQRNLIVPLNKLVDMHKKLSGYTDHLLAYFFKFIVYGQKREYHTFLQRQENEKCKDYLVKGYPEILPIIEFVLSQKFRDVIKAMKRLACTSSSAKTLRENWYCDTKDIGYIYSFFSSYNSFWNREGKLDDLILPGENNVVDNQQVTFKEEEGPSLEQWQQFVDEKMIQPGILQGVFKSDIFDAITTLDHELKPRFEAYLSYKEFLDTYTGQHKTGIISNVVNLQIEACMDKFLGLLTRVTLYSVKPRGHLSLKAADYQGPKYTLRQVTAFLCSVQSDKKWRYKSILKRVKDTFDEKLMEFPDFEQGAEKIAIHLQERIRRIVLKMIERQYESIKEKHFLYYPECQFMQLILPCFVASFLDLDKDPSASQETKRKYFNFLHELVKSYETSEFSNKITSALDKIPFDSAVHEGFQSNYLQRRCEFVENILCDVLCNSKICNDFVSKGVSSNFVVDSLGEDEEYYMKTMYWSQLVFMFSSRLCAVVKKMGFSYSKGLYYFEDRILNQLSNVKTLSTEQMWILKLQQFVKYISKFQDLADEEMHNLLDLGVPQQMIQDAQEISEPYLDGLLLYIMVKNFTPDSITLIDPDWIQGPGFPIDPVVSVIWSLYAKDMWKLKIEVSNFYNMREENLDPTLAPFDVADSNLCYKSILTLITSDGKVRMSRPGEITFFPVKHCRWCGQVKVKEFRVCLVCADTPEYPDLNLFCSEKCEKEALEKQHEEEHINFLIEQCGIEK